ncbi:helix-turn-helix transcriptional regulator [Streptomyces sp. I05A-00742]|uniref:helix-turn-helix domain-containing protein n=1 Tax=Streptomyces sp. I05A-00742 TaxID=2732853 RepID=UPI001488C7DE|nr:helix-turn-helix transcriptional regulator [Streptomyces sp. I05A-00742]
MAWRLCGNQVKLWRMEAGVSREQLGAEAGYELETVKAMEQGRRRPTLRLLDIADEMCGARGKLRAAAGFLEPERFARRVREFVVAEASAIAIHSYQTLLIPGLLQTEEYARQLMTRHCPPMDDEAVEQQLAGRLARQGLLKKHDVMFTFVIYEAALRTGIGGPQAMKRQLHHLLAVGQQRNVIIQVLPADRGMNPGLYGPFVLLETPEFDYCAFEEGQNTGVLYAGSEQISLLMKRHAVIRMEALNAEESAELIAKAAEQL